VAGSEILQRVSDLAVEAAGYYAMPDAARMGDNEAIGPDQARGVAGRYFNLRKVSIYGGSNEIQRNIIAKAVLGL
jgi:alkylation response protein AidB-like acyl-CoA dehydrogenase